MDSRESEMLVQTRPRIESRWRRGLQLALLPALPGSALSDPEGRDRPRRTPRTAVFCRTGSCIRPIGTGASNKSSAANLRAVSDIGTHAMDLLMFLTGKKITEVCADLATVISVRRKPRGRVETFKKAESTAYDEMPMTTDDYATHAASFSGWLARRRHCFASQRRPQSQAELRHRRFESLACGGMPKIPTRCGSAVAIPRTARCSKIPR